MFQFLLFEAFYSDEIKIINLGLKNKAYRITMHRFKDKRWIHLFKKIENFCAKFVQILRHKIKRFSTIVKKEKFIVYDGLKNV